jgi:hypothetical protein
MFEFVAVECFPLFSIFYKGAGAMVGDVLLHICGRGRFVPARGAASSLVVFSSQRCGISTRTPIMACASTTVLAEVTPRPAFRRQHLQGKVVLRDAAGRLRAQRSI